uniref:CARD domain-containing protein n=1 Tax=Amphimedon queenslandica TaxID=400682 RepID=A0A1X7TQ78_AMPQE
MNQQLYASVYSSQGTTEQLLISRTIQLLNSEEELASIQQLKEKNEKLEAEMKVLSGMKWEVDQLRTREMEKIEMLQEKISVQGMEILKKESQQKQLQKFLEEKELERKTELQKIDKLFYSSLQEKDTELQEVIQMQQVNDTQYLQAKRVLLEHFIELSVAMAVTPNRLSVVKQLFDSGLVSETNLHQATEDDTVSGIEKGAVLMKELKAFINERPELISSLVAVLEENEAFKSIAKRIGKDIPPTLRMYYGQVLYVVKTPGLEWLMRVIFDRDLSRIKTYINDKIKNAELGDFFSFTFNDADGYIELCFNEMPSKGWSIRPHKTPVIASRYDIEECGNMSPPQFPECLVTITATLDIDAIKELNYPVTMRGVKSNVEKINIVLTSETVQKDQTTTNYPATQISESNDDQQK